MIKQIKNNVSSITIDDIIKNLNHNQSLIIFYTHNNKRDGMPIMLHSTGQEWEFRKPTCNEDITYSSDDLLKLLTTVSKDYILWSLESN